MFNVPTLAADTLTFAAPLWLWVALAVVPLAVALFAGAERRASRRLARLVAPALRGRLLAGAEGPGRRRVRFGLWTLALAALAVALARPQRGFVEQPVKRRGLDLLVAVDVSKSMLATDLAPSRLGRARLAVLDLLDLLPGDRVGLVAFAGTAFLQAPLTIDYGAIREAAAELDPDLIPRGGTDLAGAMDTALDAFGKAEGSNRAILLLTDGEDLGEDALAAAGRAAKAGARIFTVGLGTTAGANIPLPRGPFDRNRGGGGSDDAIARERDGQPHVSRLDEERLRAIATATGGNYVHLTGGVAGGQPREGGELRGLVTRGLGAMQAADIDARANRRPLERYRWPLGLALLLLAASTLVGERAFSSRHHRDERRRQTPTPPLPPAARAPRPAATAAMATMAAFLCLATWWFPTSARGATATVATDPRELYDQGRYQEAWQAYTELLKRSPGSGQLQFNAGASAYAAGEYDPALENFSGALTAPDADAALQAKTLYNLGNTLFKRGEAQKEGSDARLNDWKNSIQYFNSVLQTTPSPLSTPPGADPKNTADPLRRDAEHNRDLVQRRLDEELKKRPPPSSPKPQKKPPKKPDDGKKQGKDKNKDQNRQPSQPDQGDEPNPGQSDKPDDGRDGQENDGSGQQPPRPDAKSRSDSGDSDQPPQGDDASGRSRRDRHPADGQGDKPQDEASQTPREGEGSEDGRQADNQPEPDRQGARPRGELTARDAGNQPAPEAAPEGKPVEADGQPAGGRMNAAQARALLNALRNEDDRVQLFQPTHKNPPRESAFNDW